MMVRKASMSLMASGQASHNQKGIALVTVMLVMVIMTVIGIAAITVTGLENRMAGFQRTGEAAFTAAESCAGIGVSVIQQTILAGQLPITLIGVAGPVPTAAETGVLAPNRSLTQEIMGQADNEVDTTVANPDIDLTQTNTMNGFTVRGDIDRLYAKAKAGGAAQSHGGYDGIGMGAAGGGVDIYYRITCIATNIATNTTSQISAVYACTATGDSCQKKF